MKTIQTNNFKKLGANRGGVVGPAPAAIPLAPAKPSTQPAQPIQTGQPAQPLNQTQSQKSQELSNRIKRSFKSLYINTSPFDGQIDALVGAIVRNNPTIRLSSDKKAIAQTGPNYNKQVYDVLYRELSSLNINVTSVHTELTNLVTQMVSSLKPNQLDLLLQRGLGLRSQSRSRGRQTVMTHEPKNFWADRSNHLINELAKGGPSWW